MDFGVPEGKEGVASFYFQRIKDCANFSSHLKSRANLLKHSTEDIGPDTE